MESNNSILLRLSNIDYSYDHGINQTQVLRNISFELKRGEVLGVIGPNGGGKSTLLNLICGHLQPSKGTIDYFPSLTKIKIQHVPQVIKFNFLLPLDVQNFLELPQKCQSRKNVKNIKYDLDFFNDILNKVGLEKLATKQMSQLSIGQRQRTLLAQAILQRPDVLILDEPQTGLDGLGQDQFYEILSWLKESGKTGIILVDHNLTSVIRKSDNILCLNKTHHWHNHPSQLTNQVLASIYHCELEHLLIHQQDPSNMTHHECTKDHGEETK